MAVNEKLRVGVIFGGRSGEHDVSLASARSVMAALDRQKYEIIQIGITPDGNWQTGRDVHSTFTGSTGSDLSDCTMLPDPTRTGLYTLERENNRTLLKLLEELDVVFPVLHGTFGEDGTLQGLLEMAGVAYVGAGVTGSAVGMDKHIFKHLMRAHGLPVVDWTLILRSELEADPEDALQRAAAVADFPLFVKPANLGSSVGITKCRSRSDLSEGLQEAARFDRRIIVERGLQAREIEVSVLGNDAPQASIPGEIVPEADFYSYEAKYHDERSRLLIPAPLTSEQTEDIRRLAIQAYQAMDCAGMARVDFLLDKSDLSLYLNEANTIPGFTKISMYPKLWEASGLPYAELLNRLIQLALERRADRQRTKYRL